MRVVCRDYRCYRWAASLNLKQFGDLAAVISWGSLFHSQMVRGGGVNDICLWCVLQKDMVLLCVLFFLRLNRFSVGFGRYE